MRTTIKPSCLGNFWTKTFMALCAVAAVMGSLPGVRAADILVVYGAGKFNRGDDAMVSHLLKAGYSVNAKSDAQVGASDTDGMNLVIISDSVSDQRLGATFRDVKVPILCSEAFQLDDLGMTSPQKGSDYGRAPGRQAIHIRDGGHSLAAGLNGLVTVSRQPFPMGWGIPGGSADLIATLGGSAAGPVDASAQSRYALFSYEVGTPMPGLTAPALRMGLFLSSSTWSHATRDGLKLFDAAVDHGVRASGGGSVLGTPCPKAIEDTCTTCQSNEHKVTFVNDSGETIWIGIWGTSPSPTGYDPPSDLPGWKLEAGKTASWCAPHGFNGGLFPRTKCLAADGKTWAGCASADCGGMKCTTGHQKASFCEINFDDPNKKTWYDVSYVDAYTFPIQLSVDNYGGTPDHPSNWCWTAGCTTLPSCPWTTRGDGICVGPCGEFELRHTDYPSKNYAQHIAVCCKCSEVGSCTCGDPCCAGRCGCTPNGGIGPSNPGYNQRCKDPFTMDGSSQCDWSVSSLDPDTDWRDYPKAIKPVCADSYTWQYHDTAGDMNCRNDDDTPLNFTVTFGPR